MREVLLSSYFYQTTLLKLLLSNYFIQATFIKPFQPNLCRHKKFFYSLKLIQ